MKRITVKISEEKYDEFDDSYLDKEWDGDKLADWDNFARQSMNDILRAVCEGESEVTIK